MEEIEKYVKELKQSAQLTDEQGTRLQETMVDLTNLMLQAASNPTDSLILTEINLCKITIESLGVVSFNQVQDKAKEVATDAFIKGLSIALSSL